MRDRLPGDLRLEPKPDGTVKTGCAGGSQGLVASGHRAGRFRKKRGLLPQQRGHRESQGWHQQRDRETRSDTRFCSLPMPPAPAPAERLRGATFARQEREERGIRVELQTKQSPQQAKVRNLTYRLPLSISGIVHHSSSSIFSASNLHPEPLSESSLNPRLWVPTRLGRSLAQQRASEGLVE